MTTIRDAKQPKRIHLSNNFGYNKFHFKHFFKKSIEKKNELFHSVRSYENIFIIFNKRNTFTDVLKLT